MKFRDSPSGCLTKCIDPRPKIIPFFCVLISFDKNGIFHGRVCNGLCLSSNIRISLQINGAFSNVSSGYYFVERFFNSEDEHRIRNVDWRSNYSTQVIVENKKVKESSFQASYVGAGNDLRR